MLQAIFWDNDGVLVDSERIFFRACREILAEEGAHLDEETFAEWSLRRGRSVVELLEGLSAEERERVRLRRNARYEQLLSAGVDVFAGVEQALEALHGELPMAIVTSSNPEPFRMIHGQTGLLRYFEFALLPGDYERHKPHPEPYLRAADRMGVEPEACLVVEDSERGLEAAARAGMRCVMIPNALASEADLSAAFAVVEGAHELPGLVESIRRAPMLGDPAD